MDGFTVQVGVYFTRRVLLYKDGCTLQGEVSEQRGVYCKKRGVLYKEMGNVKSWVYYTRIGVL